VSLERPFDRPVPLPKGAPARTLRDAADFIRKLPKVEQDRAEWQIALDLVIDAAENRGPIMFAKMAILEAVRRKGECVYELARRDRSQ
jgi:hypothetical protein